MGRKLGFSLLALSFISCIRREPTAIPKMELSLYSGVQNLVRLGESEAQVASRAPANLERGDLKDEPKLLELRMTHSVSYPETGVKAFFRNGRVALIQIQEPFRGEVLGKRLTVFPFAKPPGNSWEEYLIRELGSPVDQATGGRFGSSALFYSWGDIAFNAMGPNQIALYRDLELAKYRQQNFGRVIRFFEKN